MHDFSLSHHNWQVSDAEELYRIPDWGSGFYQASESGDLEILLGEANDVPVSLPEMAKRLNEMGLELPVLLRFPDVLSARLNQLHREFSQAIERRGYKGRYRGVLPIKVNQKRGFIESATRFGAPFHYGLEVGSKAELIVALTMLKDHDAYIICNGYKDSDYIRLAQLAMKSGYKVVIVIEIPSEVDALLAVADELAIEPTLGLRYRLSRPGSGRWSSSNGETGLFGLDGRDSIRVIDQLRRADRLGCLRMLHFHQGSQLYDLNGIRAGVREAARVYADLVREGATMGALNLGGGLAIDYDGTETAAQSSKNYSINQYCEALVRETADVLDECEVEHPTLLTESGRGVSAHASALIFEVFGAGSHSSSGSAISVPKDAPQRVREILEEIANSARNRPNEFVSKPNVWRQELQERYARGELRLRDLAAIDEALEVACAAQARASEQPNALPPSILYGNFSIFQSLPDHWALGQTFPILPIHRLDERPEQNAILADLTCDSDGKIRTYISSEEAQSLPVHALDENEPYLFGAFLTGAYQEILGDKHNLFGAPPVVDVSVEDGELTINPSSVSESVEDVLSSIGYDPAETTQAIQEMGKSSDDQTRTDELLRFAENVRANSSYLRSPTLG